MLVQAQLREDPGEANVGCLRHALILTEYEMKPQRTQRTRRKEDMGRYSYLSASIGSNLAAFIAGSIPLTMPTKLRIAVDHRSVAESMNK